MSSSTATAQVVLAQAAPRPHFLESPLAPLLLVFVVFYFLLVRPQQKRAKEHKALVDGLKRNDKVITSSGIFGRILEVAEQSVVLEIAPNVSIRLERSQIGGLQKEKKEG